MTKDFVIFVYICVTVITAFFAYHASRKKDKVAKTLHIVLFIATIDCLSYLITLIANDYRIISIAFSFVFISTVSLTYYLIQYAKQYTGLDIIIPKFNIVLKVLIIIDIIILAINPFTNIAANFYSIIYNGDIYVQFRPFLLFNMHLLICYIAILFFVCMFIRKIIAVADIYKKKYLTILIGVLLIVAINAIFIFYTLPFDISIIGFAIMSSLIYYFSFQYFPKSFTNQVNSVIITHLDSPVFMFDSQHLCIYRNQKALEIFSIFQKNQRYMLEDICQKLNLCGEIHLGHKSVFEHHFENQTNPKDYIVIFDQLYDKNNKYIGSSLIMHDTTDKNIMLQQLHDLAYFDSLTKLNNHVRFCQEVTKLFDEYPFKEFSIIKFDIQRFKHINEILGEKVGDTVLYTIAEGMRKVLPEYCVYGKAETDHFVICLFQEEDFLSYIKAIFKYLHNELKLTITIIPSIGIYKVDDISIPVTQMCDWANLASHSVKGNYVLQHAYYEKSLSQQVLGEQGIINDLQTSLDNDWFHIYVQPQYHHQDKTIIGGEVLTRWIHPDKGVIAPSSFIPLFERNGFIVRLDEYIWEKTCQYLRHWLDNGSKVSKLPLSINISRADFYYMNVEEVLLKLTNKYNIPKHILPLEITESSYTDDLNNMIEIVTHLQELGFIIEMDDFGAGYSSLALLRELPVNIIKLDMCFLTNDLNDANAEKTRHILKGVIRMLQSIELPIIVEGVETEEQADFVSDLECHHIQGYYYSKPIPIEDYFELVEKTNK